MEHRHHNIRQIFHRLFFVYLHIKNKFVIFPFHITLKSCNVDLKRLDDQILETNKKTKQKQKNKTQKQKNKKTKR